MSAVTGHIRKPGAVISALVLLAAIFVFTGPAAEANHPSGSCLDLNPETDSNPVGTNHTITATFRTAGAPKEPGDAPCDEDDTAVLATSNVTISFEITGANDPDAGNTPATPDEDCNITPGLSSCTMTYQGTSTGTDTIRGWIDHVPGPGGTTEADTAEGRNELTSPGTGCVDTGAPAELPEPDCTDVVEKTWTHGPPATLDCDDSGPPDTERETNPHSRGGASDETYICRVLDTQGNQTTETAVNIRGEHKDGTNDPDNPDAVAYETPPPDHQCTTATTGTPNRGQCSITVTQADNEIGKTDICFWIESYTFDTNPAVNNDGAALCSNEVTGEAQDQQTGADTGNDAADQVEKTWEESRASSVDAEPETDTNPTGSDHTIRAFVYDQFGVQFQGTPTTVKFEWFQGSPGDTDSATNPSTPDRTCQTTTSNTCAVTYSAGTAGTDLVCVWVGNSPPNMTGNNTNGTCDGETLNDPDDEPSQTNPPTGDAPDPAGDDQDVVQKTWQNANAATRLDCEPETDTNPVGTAHSVTCTARNASNATVPQTQIDAEATGANDPDGNSDMTSPEFSCTTNNEGVCSFTHGPSGTTQNGVTTYRAWIDSDNSNNSPEADPTEAQNEGGAGAGQRAEPDDTDVVAKTWQGGTNSPSGSATASPTASPTQTTTASPSPSTTPKPECSDGLDNDGDGRTDFPADRGCTSSTDTSEQSPAGAEACEQEGAGGRNVIIGTDGADVLTGTDGNDLICAAAGSDVVSALSGKDLVLLGAGDDSGSGGDGKDSINGGGGNDTVQGGKANDALKGQGGSDTLKGNAGIDSLTGGGGGDSLQGGDDDDILKGGSGGDSLRGGQGERLPRWWRRTRQLFGQ